MMKEVLAFLSSGYFILGLMILLLVCIIVIIITMVKVNKLKKRLDQFVLGKNGESLEEDIASLYKDHQHMTEKVEENRISIKNLDQEFDHAYQKVGIVKYDAFQHVGGQLSFSLAMLNRMNDGFVINSVHSTDGCYSYTKEIKNGKCLVTLGKEENEALATAMKQ